MSRTYCVYILASLGRRLYVGVTSNLARRLEEHHELDPSSFTGRYLINRLVHVECCGRALDAIAREKEIKGWSRSKKVALIEASNPHWRDLTGEVLASRMLG
jgi:putative endonuclease